MGATALELLETAREKPAEGPASFFRWATDLLGHASYMTKEDKDARYVDELHAAAERAQREGLSLATFLEELAVDEPAEDEHDDRVTLSTVHRAKGLEWQHVILCWPGRGHLADLEGHHRGEAGGGASLLVRQRHPDQGVTSHPLDRRPPIAPPSRAADGRRGRGVMARRKKNKDGHCHRCGRLVPPPRPTPEGWWPRRERLYCSPDCRAEATKERARKTPGVADVLVACLRAGIEVLPYLDGNRPATTGVLDRLAPEILAGLARHADEMVQAVTRAEAVMAGSPLLPEHTKVSWLACSRCGEAQVVADDQANRRCRMTYGCPGRLVLRVVPSVERPGLPGCPTVERASTA